MKKAFISGFLGIAFAFAMVACNGNAANTDTVADTTGATMEQEECMHHCQMTCPDSVCLANNCENCTCPEDSPCHMKACKGEGNGECCKKAEGCQHDGSCKKDEGCKKADGQGCCKKDGNGECKKQCEKAK